jgi:hypothetical protein
MSDNLFICKRDQTELDRETIVGFFSTFPEISDRNFSEREKVDLQIDFSFRGRKYMANLANDRLALVIEEVSEETLEITWRLQKSYPEELFVFNESYDFDFSLREFSTLPALIEAY